MALVPTAVADGVMTITLADEPRRNALSAELTNELVDAFQAAESDERVRVVVLTNSGKVFCAGANLAEQSSRKTITISSSYRAIRTRRIGSSRWMSAAASPAAPWGS